jgi:uncharacterized membrane protein
LKDKNDVVHSRRFLLKRGLWLILLEFTVVNLGLFFDPGFHTLLFQVIGAIGVGFIILSLLLKLSFRTIGIIGVIIVFCHNLLPLIPFGPGSMIKTILSPLFGLGVFPGLLHRTLIVSYPPIPWLGIMLVGFSAGKLFELSADIRRRIFVQIGAGTLLLFVLLRWINMYGDPVLWSSQKTVLYSFLSFMNITKYPPSLLFCLVTLGIMFLMLAVVEQKSNKFTAISNTYGKVPLFYFVLHFYIIHVLLIIVLFGQGFHWADLQFATGTFGRPKDMESGVSLRMVYIIWIGVVMVLYKPCVWFAKYKATHKYRWLRYM